MGGLHASYALDPEPGDTMPRLILPPGAFRLVLAAAVMASHLSGYDVGRLAVILFFCLSGYWTARIWDEKFTDGGVVRFYASRYLRIAPLFFLATLSAAWVRGMDLGLVNLTLLGLASAPSAQDPTQVSWSLDIELQFYLLLPLILPLIRANPGMAVVASVVACAAGVGLEAWTGAVTVLKYMPAFVLGAVTHVVRYQPSERAAHLSLIAFAALTALAVLTPFFRKDTPDPFDRDLFALVWCLPLLPYAARSLMIRSSPVDRDLGNLSYPLYLFHPAVIFVGHDIFGRGLPAKVAIVLLASVAALAVYRYVDRPLDKVRALLTDRVRKPSVQTT